MTKIGFYGACGVVTGSCYKVSTDNQAPVLVDCGMFQGVAEVEAFNKKPLGFNPATLSGAIVTHAHLDHCGRLPLLIQGGFDSPVYMTQATSDLVELTLLDAAKIQEYEEDIWFSRADVEQLLSLIRVINYHQHFDVGEYRAELVDAGHILGAASVILTHKQTSEVVVFSGDLGNSPQDLIRPTENIEKADVVVMESTYGDKDHPVENAASILVESINQVEKTGGTMLIPAFSIERTQEVLHLLDHMKKDGKVGKGTAVFLDSPMAIRATRIFQKYHNLYNEELKQHVREDDPFDFPGLEMTMKGGESKRIAKHKGPKVIIAGSGMMSGGRILRHAAQYLPRKDTMLVFVGYQGLETLGREIQEGVSVVVIDGQEVEIKAQVRTISAISSHAGQTALVNWLEHIQGVKKVFVTHGDEEPRRELKDMLVSRNGDYEVMLPELGQVLAA